MHVIAVDRPGVNDHFVRPGCLANQLAASLPHVAAENGEPIFRNPYNVVLAVPDRMAAAFVALHDPVYTGPAADPCRLQGVGFPDPLSGALKPREKFARDEAEPERQKEDAKTQLHGAPVAGIKGPRALALQ